jgi:hypothetical protein
MSKIQSEPPRSHSIGKSMEVTLPQAVTFSGCTKLHRIDQSLFSAGWMVCFLHVNISFWH